MLFKESNKWRTNFLETACDHERVRESKSWPHLHFHHLAHRVVQTQHLTLDFTIAKIGMLIPISTVVSIK